MKWSWLSCERMSDNYLTPNEQFLSYISWQEEVTLWWDDDEVHFVLNQNAELDSYRNNSPRVDMLLNSDSLVWLWANHSLALLFNAVWLAEHQQIPILQFLVRPAQSLNPRSTAPEARMLTITPPMQCWLLCTCTLACRVKKVHCWILISITL